MEIQLSSKGNKYAESLMNQNIEIGSTEGTDIAILSIIGTSGSLDLENFLEECGNDPIVRSAIRRLFEAGYIEQV